MALNLHLLPSTPALRPYVREYWVIRQTLDQPRADWMHAGGAFGLVFNLGDALALDGEPLAGRVHLDGTNTFSRAMHFNGQIYAVGVRFQVGGAYPVLGEPLHSLANQTTRIETWRSAEVLERLHAAHSPVAQGAILDDWLLARVKVGPPPSALVMATVACLQQTGGQLSMATLAEQHAISQRQLERLFQTHVGMTPKQMARLMQVQGARLALKGSRPASAIGAEAGFFDQAHFIRAFRAVVGMTPEQYRQRR